MVREILKWQDKKIDELHAKDDIGNKEYAKAFGLGALEGFIDGMVVVGLLAFAAGIIEGVKQLKN